MEISRRDRQDLGLEATAMVSSVAAVKMEEEEEEEEDEKSLCRVEATAADARADR